MNRRRFLGGAAATAGALVFGGRLPLRAIEQSGFPHGVASGDPLADRVILWTRYPSGGDVTWQVATDPSFTAISAQGSASALAMHDYTIHVDPTGLTSDTQYWYRFTTSTGEHSPVGRTRTAPAGTTESLRFAFVSCSSYEAGFFNPYARLGRRDDLSFVVHLGDYFYEGGGGSGLVGRPHDPPHELLTLNDYRRRYAQYRSDLDLQLAHAMHPWIVVWDDHESANNSWSSGARNHQLSEGDWAQRKAWAIQAWREWLPVRWPDQDDAVRIWRSFAFGDLVDLVMIDTRLHGREPGDTPTGTFDIGSNDPARTMLGATQKAWLLDKLASSTTRWRVIGNQTMISPHRNDPEQPPLPYLPPDVIDELDVVRQGGGNEGQDNWGAYQVERDEVIRFLRDRSIANNVVITGDIHTSWAADITEDPYTPYLDGVSAGLTGAPGYESVTGLGSVGVELVCMSVTSNNFEESADPLADAQIAAFNTAIVATNPNVQYSDVAAHGYVLVDVNRQRMLAEWWETGTAHVHAPDMPETLAASFASYHGAPGAPFTDHLVAEAVGSLLGLESLLG